MADGVVSAPDAPEPRSAHTLRNVTAVVTALGGLVAAVWGIVEIFHGGDSGRSTSAVSQTATVAVREPQLAGSQATFDIDVGVTGRKGETIRVTWTLWDRDTGSPISADGFEEQPVATFSPPSNELVERTFQAAVPAPSQSEIVFLRVELFDEVGERFAFDDGPLLELGGLTPSSAGSG